MPRLFVAAAMVVAFIGNAAGDTLDPQVRSGGSSLKEDCSSAPSGSTSKGKSANLSDQLAQSNGVICPPSGVDPKMATPPRGRRHARYSPTGRARRRSEYRPEMRNAPAASTPEASHLHQGGGKRRLLTGITAISRR